MPVLKIVQKGMESYSGFIGEVEFKGGVSTNPVSRSEARRIAACMSVVDAKTGKNPSATQEMVDQRSFTLRDMENAKRQSTKLDAEDVEESETTDAEQAEQPDQVGELNWDWTREDLEAKADAGGIGELREFAKPYGVNGRAIVDIIDDLCAKNPNIEG